VDPQVTAIKFRGKYSSHVANMCELFSSLCFYKCRNFTQKFQIENYVHNNSTYMSYSYTGQWEMVS